MTDRLLPIGATANGWDTSDLALYVVASEPYGVPWEFRWVAWPDFGLPSDPVATRAALAEAWGRADRERVEVGCMGGRGRTGTALDTARFEESPDRSTWSWTRYSHGPLLLLSR